MIYHFRAISNESDDFIIEIAIDGSSPFVKLHELLQEKLGFDKGQMASFFMTDSEWNKELEITLINMMDEEDGSLVMDKVAIEDMVHETRQRMLYVFDLFSERVLFMELTRVDEGHVKRPTCTRFEGTPPAQLQWPEAQEPGFDDDDFNVMEQDDIFDPDNDHTDWNIEEGNELEKDY